MRLAGVLEKALLVKDKRRVRHNFDSAMDTLEACGVCEHWDYNKDDDSKVNPGARGWFDRWLGVHAEVIPPPVVKQAVREAAQAEKKDRKRAKARTANKS